MITVLLRRGSFAWVVAASGLLHAGAYLASDAWIDETWERVETVAELVELVDVPARASTPPEPEIPAPEVVDPEPAPAPRRSPPRARPDPSPRPRRESEPSTDPTPAPEPPAFADLTGVTLEAAGGSWSAPAGNGASRDGPAVSRPGRPSVGGPGAPSPAPRGPRVVASSDLSRRPAPPSDLATLLEAHFPPLARARGQSGRAILRARVHADGSIGVLAVVSASRPEFGEACRAALRGSRWTPPLDDRGRPVATDVRYACRFEVD